MSSRAKLRISEETRDLIRHMHPDLKKKVRSALSEIIENPFSGTSLIVELKGLRSSRVGRFRIIYRPSPESIEIIAIGPRHIIYEETYKLIKKKE
ncbi:MAG: type II toxin-antitoxin system RelE/ParE family toxin [Thermodesulfobacteriota bacterium]